MSAFASSDSAPACRRRERQADTGRHSHFHPAERRRAAQVPRSTTPPDARLRRSCVIRSSRMANSSPPSRATVSEARVLLTRRCATACSSRSPGIVAQRVVDGLEVVEIEEHDRDLVLAALRQRQRMLHPVLNRVRLASSVSGSWNAICRSCSSSALRSLMSRKIQRESLHRRIRCQIAADDLEHVAIRSALDSAAPPGRRSRGCRGDSVSRARNRSPSSARPRRRGDSYPTRSSGFESQRTLACGRSETQRAIRLDDHDDVGCVRDQRGVARPRPCARRGARASTRRLAEPAPAAPSRAT